ncbi:MAG: asparagine synthase (glutamine-hydrolyzing) [Alphaproteobacteria bacterium]
MSADGSPPDAATLDLLADALAHRGPDGRGRHVEGALGLVHDRLSIIDLATGAQPLFDEAGNALIANAEIYNHVELRREIGEAAFRTGSDCEVPLRLYAACGLDFVDRLRGMYAIALHDRARGRLVLARDPFGIKPLYYAETPAGFAFASEPQALIAARLVPPVLHGHARDELIAFQFTTGNDTVFRGIRRVLPGELIVVERGRIAERRRRPALPDGGPEAIGEDEALIRLDAALDDSVNVHQRADVPYGMFLSGGIDSSALLAVMARLNPRPVLAFTAGFPGTAARDERVLARTVAKTFNAEHIDVPFDAADFWRLLPYVAAALDDPITDYAALPSFKLAEVAKAHVKVVLSGEGGDEMFAGYGRYRGLLRPFWLGGPKPMRARHRFAGLGVLREEPKDWRAGLDAAERDAARPGWDALQRAQAADCADWLAHDLLTKLDRCLMAHGVEGRTPFLDPAIAAAAFRLPKRLKLRGRLGKWLLRRWLAERAPMAEAFSRKRGFTVPVGEWIAAEAGRLGPLLARQPAVEALCLPGSVERLCASAATGKAASAAWCLVFYALWHRRHIEGRRPCGDAFETLAERG